MAPLYKRRRRRTRLAIAVDKLPLLQLPGRRPRGLACHCRDLQRPLARASGGDCGSRDRLLGPLPPCPDRALDRQPRLGALVPWAVPPGTLARQRLPLRPRPGGTAPILGPRRLLSARASKGERAPGRDPPGAGVLPGLLPFGLRPGHGARPALVQQPGRRILLHLRAVHRHHLLGPARHGAGRGADRSAPRHGAAHSRLQPADHLSHVRAPAPHLVREPAPRGPFPGGSPALRALENGELPPALPGLFRAARAASHCEVQTKPLVARGDFPPGPGRHVD